MRELNNPDHKLEYIIKDCSEAISANPLNPKTEHYLTLARACQAELIRRQIIRIDRKLTSVDTDVLNWRLIEGIKPALKTLIKTWRRAQGYDIDRAREGAINIGLRNLHLTKGA